MILVLFDVRRDYEVKTISYYLHPKNEKYDYLDLNFGSCEDLSRPLVLNCAGYVNANYNHTNTNTHGRLDYYLIYLVSGEIEFLDNKNVTKLTKGNLIVYPSKTQYKYKCIADKENVQFFWAHFTGSEVTYILKSYGISLFPYVHKINVNNHIDARFKAIFDAFAINDKYRDSDLSALLDRLLIEIGRVLSITGTGIGRLHKSVRYINEHFTEQIKITELAKIENMCMTTFNLHFKKYMGLAPSKYIIKLRMQLAIDLLLNSELSIQEISLHCGYNDYNFFTKVFKSEIGVPPTEYRKGFKQ